MENKSVNSKTLAVMFIDLVGYTYKTTQLNREDFNKLHDKFDSLALPLFSSFSGTVINKVGDAFLVTFESPTNAILCGVKLQEKFNDYNQKNIKSDNLQIRIAIDHGEVLIRDKNVYGDAVNTAARVEGKTWPNHIFFTESVLQAMNKNEVKYLEVGYANLKGLPYPVRIFRVMTAADKIKKYKAIATNVVLGTFLLVLTYFLINYINSNPETLSSAATTIKNIKLK